MDNFLTSGWSRKAYIRSKSQESALCMAFSNDDRSIVTGSFDGMLSGYDCASSSLKFNFDTSLIDTKNHSPTRYPITVLQFRPVNIGEEVLLIGCSNGVLLHWNPRQQHLLRKTVESDNDIYTASYSPDGNLHATGGRDGTVRVYDEHSGTLLTSFAKALVAESIVNANRIYSVKWADSHVLLSGGWDNSISVWDIRTASKTTVRSHQPSTDRVVRSPVRTIFGPYLCGDGLDIHGHTILTASHRLENPIELWDLSTGNKIKDYAWPPVRAGGVQGSSLQEHQSTNTMVMGASFSPNGSLIGVGGSGGLGLTNVALLLNKDSGESILECPTEKGVNSVLFGHKEAFFAFADGAGRLHMYERRES